MSREIGIGKAGVGSQKINKDQVIEYELGSSNSGPRPRTGVRQKGIVVGPYCA